MYRAFKSGLLFFFFFFSFLFFFFSAPRGVPEQLGPRRAGPDGRLRGSPLGIGRTDAAVFTGVAVNTDGAACQRGARSSSLCMERQ